MGAVSYLLGVLVGVACWRPLDSVPADAKTTGVIDPNSLGDGHFYISYLDNDFKTNLRHLTRPDLFLIRFGYAANWNESVVRSKIKNGKPIGLEGKELTNALKAYQRQNDLPITGQVDTLTRKSMLKPRCGVSDVQRGRFTIFPNKWESNTLSYNFVKYSDILPRSVIELALERAFGYWENVTPLRFVRKPDGEMADLRIGFYSGYHRDDVHNSFDGPNGIYGHAFFPREGNIHFDDDEDFTENTPKGKNLRIIAAHEIGHALGLDHSWTKGSLMFPRYQGYVPHDKFKLGSDDIAGIRHMYGPRINVEADGYSETMDLESMMMNDWHQIDEKTPSKTGDDSGPFTTTTTTQMFTTTTKTPVTVRMWPKPTAGMGDPDPCVAKVDAAFLWHDGAKYFLRGTLLYRQGPGESSMMSLDFPRNVRRYLIDAPLKTDAAVYSPYSANLFLFKGRFVYVYDRHGYLRRKERMIQADFPINMDAAFVNRDGTVCLLKDDLLYEFDEWRYMIENVLPISSVYGGLPMGIDAVINDSPYVLDYEYIYFFKGSSYYKVDMRSRSVMRHYPRKIGGPWFGCSTWTVPK